MMLKQYVGNVSVAISHCLQVTWVFLKRLPKCMLLLSTDFEVAVAIF